MKTVIKKIKLLFGSLFKKISINIILVIILSAAIRFIPLKKLLAFTPDEEYLIYLANTIIKNFHIIWIGVSSLGFGVYMGPFWIYIITPLLLIAKGDPLILGYFACFFGILTTYLLYWLGQKMFNKKIGLIAALLYAASPLIVFYDQKSYPSAVPFLSLLLALTIYLSKYSKKWWILFSIAYGMVFHIHLSLILIILVAFYWAWLNKKNLNPKVILLSILAFLLTVFPLIAFDYFHKGSNITTPVRIIQSAKSSPFKINLKSRSIVFLNALGRVMHLEAGRESSDEILNPCIVDKLTTTSRPHWLFILPAVFCLLFFFFNKKTWKEENNKLIALLTLAFLIPFIFLPIINPVEYYLLGFFPFLFLIMAIFVESLQKTIKYIVYFLLLIFVISGIYTVAVAKGNFGMQTKQKLIDKVMNVIGKEPFELKELGACHQYEGWRYLFSVYGRRPERSSEDDNFSWLYLDEISKKPTKYSVIINETRTPLTSKLKYKYLLEEGGFTAFIIEK